MKRNNLILALALTVALVLAVTSVAMAQGTTPEPPSSDVILPDELRALLAAGIGFLVTEGLKAISGLLKKDLSGWGAAITASVVTSIVYFANALLSAIPEPGVEVAKVILTLIVALLGAFGVHKTVKRFGIPPLG